MSPLSKQLPFGCVCPEFSGARVPADRIYECIESPDPSAVPRQEPDMRVRRNAQDGTTSFWALLPERFLHDMRFI